MIGPLWMYTAFAQSRRWGELDALITHCEVHRISSLISILESPTPMLQKLTITSGELGIWINLHDDGPSLTRLNLKKCAVPWNSWRLCGGSLTYLRLCELSPPQTPSTSQLLSLLAASPALETLILSKLEYSEPLETLSDDNRIKVPLPRLRHFSIQDVAHVWHQQLTAHLSFPLPSCDQLSISSTSPAFEFSFPGFTEQVRATANPKSLATITLDSTNISLNIQNDLPGIPRPNLELDLRLIPVELMVNKILQVASVTRQTFPNHNLHLKVNALSSTVLPLLSKFGTALRITVSCEMGALFLNHYFARRSGGSLFPFPRLRWLDLTALEVPLDVIRAWIGAGLTRVHRGSMNFGVAGDGSTVEVILRGGQEGLRELWTHNVVDPAFISYLTPTGSGGRWGSRSNELWMDDLKH